MKAYLAIHYVALLFQFEISHFVYLISKESIEPWENFHDLKWIKVRLCWSIFGSWLSGLGFDVIAITPIRIIDTIENLKPIKHRSYEN
jgi:hypothetical protein